MYWPTIWQTSTPMIKVGYIDQQVVVQQYHTNAALLGPILWLMMIILESATNLAADGEYEVEVTLADKQADPNSPLYSVKSFEELNL
jgi:hypothetical protein